jgi:hypothetical protein
VPGLTDFRCDYSVRRINPHDDDNDDYDYDYDYDYDDIPF